MKALTPASDPDFVAWHDMHKHQLSSPRWDDPNFDPDEEVLDYVYLAWLEGATLGYERALKTGPPVTQDAAAINNEEKRLAADHEQEKQEGLSEYEQETRYDDLPTWHFDWVDGYICAYRDGTGGWFVRCETDDDGYRAEAETVVAHEKESLKIILRTAGLAAPTLLKRECLRVFLREEVKHRKEDEA